MSNKNGNTPAGGWKIPECRCIMRGLPVTLHLRLVTQFGAFLTLAISGLEKSAIHWCRTSSWCSFSRGKLLFISTNEQVMCQLNHQKSKLRCKGKQNIRATVLVQGQAGIQGFSNPASSLFWIEYSFDICIEIIPLLTVQKLVLKL